MTIKVIIAGFKGKMGSTAVEMVKGDAALSLAALVDPFATETEVDGVPVFKTKEEVASLEADVWVDFTTPKFAYENTRFALENGFAPVVGTTGFTPEEIEELTALSAEKGLGGLIAPNFAIGAILLMQFAAQAAKYFTLLLALSCSCNLQHRQPSISQILKSLNYTTIRRRMHRVVRLSKLPNSFHKSVSHRLKVQRMKKN